MRVRLLALAPLLALSGVIAAGCATTAESPDDAGVGPADAAPDKGSGRPPSDSGTNRKDAEVPPPDDGGDTTDAGGGGDGSTIVDAGQADAKDGGPVDAGPIDAGPAPDGGGATCQNATALVNGVLTNGNTTGAGNDYDYGVGTSNACNGAFGGFTYDGPDVAYSYTIPANKSLKIEVDPTTNWDIAVGIVTNCSTAGPSCLVGADSGFGGDPETVTYVNNTGNALQVYVIVDSYLPTEHGPFTIKATEM
jgi:hypothetical protein